MSAGQVYWGKERVTERTVVATSCLNKLHHEQETTEPLQPEHEEI